MKKSLIYFVVWLLAASRKDKKTATFLDDVLETVEIGGEIYALSIYRPAAFENWVQTNVAAMDEIAATPAKPKVIY